MNEDDLELRRLWRLCADQHASEADWKLLYQLVVRVLMHCNAPVLASMPDSRPIYIQEFFVDKIFQTMGPAVRGPDHCGALILFFNRYLLTKKRSIGDHVGVFPAVDVGIDGGGATGAESENKLPDGYEPFKDVDETLKEQCDKTIEDVLKAATEFLDRLQATDSTAWRLLRHGFCPDADEKMSLSAVGRTYDFPTPHYKAARLGITHSFEAGLDTFRGTVLGSWLEATLGRTLSMEIAESVWGSLEILCFQALK